MSLYDQLKGGAALDKKKQPAKGGFFDFLDVLPFVGDDKKTPAKKPTGSKLFDTLKQESKGEIAPTPREFTDIPGVGRFPKTTIGPTDKEIIVPTAAQRIKDWGNAWEVYTVQQEQKGRQEEIEKVTKELPEDYQEPTGFWGQFREAIWLGIIDNASSMAGGAEAFGKKSGGKNLEDFGIEMQDKFDKIVAQNPEWQAPQDIPETSARFKDKRYYARLMGGGLPTVLAGITTIAGAALVGGPIGAFAAGTFVFGTLEGGSAYREAKKGGATEKQAQAIFAIVGGVNGFIETAFPGIVLLRSTGALRAFNGSLTRRLTRMFIEGAITEGLFEEGTQNIFANIVAKSYDENRGTFDNVVDSIVAGTLLGGPFSELQDYTLQAPYSLLNR
ncbi:MAG TPA: hypothetical protein ENI13_00805 [candidate division CPR3 bacterium]|uniref:Uncharacterized protein n=1 Tax=candidate division CPR3 bacterium TaxID=2268181 RepID=A0A7C1SX73_UNCC3|nr:hypothetical protein [candidate division CPR3 bacterium]